MRKTIVLSAAMFLCGFGAATFTRTVAIPTLKSTTINGMDIFQRETYWKAHIEAEYMLRNPPDGQTVVECEGWLHHRRYVGDPHTKYGVYNCNWEAPPKHVYGVLLSESPAEIAQNEREAAKLYRKRK
jgi:hypothetical protein